MKQFYKFSAVALLILTCPILSKAQSVTATWSLLTDQSVSISGAGAANVTASPQVIGSAFTGVSYGYSTGTPSQTGFQRVGVTTGSPAVQGNYPTAFDTTNGYIQYSLAPVGGQSFTFNNMTFEALGNGSGGSRIAAYYSLDGFATVDSFFATYNTGTSTPYNNFPTLTTPIPLASTGSSTAYTGQQVATLTPRTGITIVANTGKTLAIRLYYFNSSVPSVSSKPLADRNVVMNGTATSAPLPLKLVDFSSTLEGGNATLLWKTQNQINVKGFEIEKSNDGKNFIVTDFVNATGSANSASYSFTDKNTFRGMNYYRIKVVDKDGTYSYSNIVIINTRLSTVLSVFPNPAVGSITITHPGISTKTQLIIYNAMGAIVKNINLVQGATQTTVNVEDLTKGIYTISCTGETTSIMFSKL